MPITPEQFREMDRRNEANKARKRGDSPAPQPAPSTVKGVRVRQSDKPLMNKLETEWFNILNAQFPNYPRPRAQAKRYRLANGAWYRPDVTASNWPCDSPNDAPGIAYSGHNRETAWECKGPREMKNVARGILTIKFAAAQWPEVRFVLVWKESGVWKQQEILP